MGISQRAPAVACNRDTSTLRPPLGADRTPPTNSRRLAETPTDFILVDLENGTVGGINLRQDGKHLEAELGADRVLETTELLEGQPSLVRCT
jgi:hypothetical protein